MPKIRGGVRHDWNWPREALAKDRLVESAKLYAETYAQDDDLRDLTEAALEDWPP